MTNILSVLIAGSLGWLISGWAHMKYIERLVDAACAFLSKREMGSEASLLRAHLRARGFTLVPPAPRKPLTWLEPG